MDAGAEATFGVGRAGVFARFRDNLDQLAGPLSAAVAALPGPAGRTCSTLVDGIEPAHEVP
jgi:hypothetical protein